MDADDVMFLEGYIGFTPDAEVHREPVLLDGSVLLHDPPARISRPEDAAWCSASTSSKRALMILPPTLIKLYLSRCVARRQLSSEF